MDEERFPPPPSASRENPRPLGSGLIVDRFRSLLPDNEDVVGVYEELLSELTSNSKPIITELTIIAGEQREYGEGISDVICERILEVPAEQKLPLLYLLDSIVKNIGHEYVKYFALRLPKVFCEAYNQVQSNMHQAMRHLFRTWSQVFPSSVLHKIEDALQFSTTDRQQPASLASVRNSESPSPRPSHGIHVNPKYLEARRQFQHPPAIGAISTQKTVQTAEFEEDGTERFVPESPNGWSGASPRFHDIERAIGNSSRLKGYGHGSSMDYGEYDTDHPEDVSPHLTRSNVGSPRAASVRTSMIEVEGPSRHFNVKVSKPLSPSRARLRRSASPLDDSFPRDSSPWRAAERTSVPYSRLGFGADRAVSENGWPERSFPSDVGTPQLDTSTAYEPNARYGKKNPRELISAYGLHDPSTEKPLKLQRMEAYSINKEARTRNWRSFEEEEYPWEDMSPTLADRSGGSSLPPLGPSSGSLSRRISLHRPDSSILGPDFRGNNRHGQTKLHSFDDSAAVVDDRVPGLRFGRGSLHTNPLHGRGVRKDQFQHYHNPNHVEELGKFPYNYQNASRELGCRSRGWSPQPSRVSGSTSAPNGQKPPGPFDNLTDVELPFLSLSANHSESANLETSVLDKHLVLRPFSPPAAPVSWPLVNKSQPLSANPSNNPFSMESNSSVQQGPNLLTFLQRHQYEGAERETSVSNQLLPLPHQRTGLVHMNTQIYDQGDGMKTQHQGAYGGYVPSVPSHLSSHLLAQPLNNAQMQQQVPIDSLPNSFSGTVNSIAMYSTVESSLPGLGGLTPPLPPGPPPGSSHVRPASQSTGSILSGSPVSAFSGLISTLMAQGLISLTPPAQKEDSLGLKFSAELLKVRHESVVNALYTDLPRQCTTCGLRFKCQEEHSNHMDWHVTKNRISKNRKQKPSRKWFVNTKEWLSGAETVGTDVVPFLPAEVVLEKKGDKEMAVPADEDQTVCALCGEPFEDFYSDEAEEWMYKGAVYLNAPDGQTNGLDRSQLGPIVHAKCRSDTNDGSC